MITCPHCHGETVPESTFCMNCGKPLDKITVYDPKVKANREVSLTEAVETIKAAEELKKRILPPED